MQDDRLQTAFEIKAACDEISRRLLRWHWEQKPGAHSFDSLLEHVEKRSEESPDYYDRIPDIGNKNGWQQLDTTLCMRVLLDPEKDASHPLDLLGDTQRPSAARRACNAVRTARNEAAHASDNEGAAQAAILFNEAIESLEEGYAGTAFSEAELAKYYRQAEEYLSGFGNKAKKQAQSKNTSASRKNSAANSTRSSSGNRTNSSRKNTGNTKRSGSKKQSKNKKRDSNANRTVLVVLLIIAVIGLVLRGCTMGA